jgi:hypothetical protein
MLSRLLRGFSIAVVFGLALASQALAGPPLLCHPFDIGAAKSLPWDGSHGWANGRADYAVANLPADLDALLTPSTPVIVRMETMRRAAIYASRDLKVAEQLKARLAARVQTAEAAGRPDPIANLDLAYLVEAFRQIGYVSYHPDFQGGATAVKNVAGSTDGYALVLKSLAARPGDPELEFAAALISADKNRAAYQEHSRKARAAASRDDLIARNLDKLL